MVEASAGSGKTYALAKRYLQLLIDPRMPLGNVPLRSILAITFTNKATVEMKERILELLKRIAFDLFASKEQEKDIYSCLETGKDFAREKALLVMDELIRHYNFFQVQTIDSFINAVLLGCALNIDRSASFKIKRDYRQYLAYCLDVVIDRASVDKKALQFMKEFLQHYLSVENRNSWFPKEDILGLLEFLFRLSNKYGGLFQQYKGKGADVIKKKISLFNKMRLLVEQIPQGMNKNAKASILNFIEKKNDIFEIKDIPAAFKKSAVPMNKAKEAPESFKKKWKNIHGEIKKLVELEATVFYNPYVVLFQEMLEEFQEVSRKEDVLFLEELNRKARLLFGDEGVTVAELYYRLATRFKHYLIDEFQDTSVLQWRNLYLMVEEALASGGSLFYVGDKKQAIYRFRGGEAQLFDRVKKKFEHFNLRQSHLTKNWRSHKAIVEFNNLVFSEQNLRRALKVSGIADELGTDKGVLEDIINVFSDAVQQYRDDYDKGYVRVERINEKNQQERNSLMREKIVCLIEQLTQRFGRQDLAILTRDNDEVQLVTSWLLEVGIPVESDKTLNILENHLVKELIAFLSFLNYPVDDLNFAAFILGDIFTAVTGIPKEDTAFLLFDLRRQGGLADQESLYRYFRSRYPGIWQDWIREFFKNVGFISPYELVLSIYRHFNLMEKFCDEQAFLMKFLELIKSKEDECVDLGEFLAYLSQAQAEELYVNVAHSEAVKVLTIHKSKGLEFPVVIIPFLRMDISPETGGKGTSSHIEDESSEDLGLLRITKHYLAYSRKLKGIYTRDYKKACIDEFNNVYVALTRAQKELYVFIPQKSANSKNKVLSIIPDNIQEKGNRVNYKQKIKAAQEFMDMPPSAYCDWISLLKEEFGDVGRIKNRERILQGNIMHAILSRIGNTIDKDKNEIVKQAIEEIKPFFPFVEDFFPYEKRADAILSEQKFSHFFYVPDGDIFCEKELVNRFGDSKRLDRLIVKNKVVWVVDYKSSFGDIQYFREQLSGYVDILKDIYPAREVKGYVICLDEFSVEEVK